VHVKDQIGGAGVWHFPAVGAGEVDFAPIFAALDKVGFAGPCSVEIEFQGEPWPPLADVTRALADSYAFVRRFVEA
jgi:sugar phosphate isomerase/epimerase